MAHWTVLQTAAQSIPDRGGDQPPLYRENWADVSRKPWESQKNGDHLWRTGEDGASGDRCRLLRERCGKVTYGNSEKSGAEGFLWDDAWEVQQQDKRHHPEKIPAACESASGGLGDRACRKWLDYGSAEDQQTENLCWRWESAAGVYEYQVPEQSASGWVHHGAQRYRGRSPFHLWCTGKTSARV